MPEKTELAITGPISSISDAVKEVIIALSNNELEMVKLVDQDDRKTFMKSYPERFARSDRFLDLFRGLGGGE